MEIEKELTIARECVLLGSYDKSLMFYASIIQYLRKKDVFVMKQIEKEMDAVKRILTIMNSYKPIISHDLKTFAKKIPPKVVSKKPSSVNVARDVERKKDNSLQVRSNLSKQTEQKDEKVKKKSHQNSVDDLKKDDVDLTNRDGEE